MKAINLLPTDLLAVVTENHLRDFYISGLNFACAYEPVRTVITELPEGNWEILGTCTADHIDFDVEPYVREDAAFFASQISYEDAFRSQVLSSNGLYFENPYGEKPIFDLDTAYDLEPRLAEWQQAESNIVQKLLIIKPLK